MYPGLTSLGRLTGIEADSERDTNQYESDDHYNQDEDIVEVRARIVITASLSSAVCRCGFVGSIWRQFLLNRHWQSSGQRLRSLSCQIVVALEAEVLEQLLTALVRIG